MFGKKLYEAREARLCCGNNSLKILMAHYSQGLSLTPAYLLGCPLVAIRQSKLLPSHHKALVTA